MDEQRKIPGFRRYTVDQQGVVWDTNTGNPRPVHANPEGALYVMLVKHGKQYGRYVARLVLQAFCPIEEDTRFSTEWIDGDKSNNALSNLRWKHRSSQDRRLTETDVREILKRWKTGRETNKQIAAAYGVTANNITQIISKRSWAWVEDDTEDEEQYLGLPISYYVRRAQNAFLG